MALAELIRVSDEAFRYLAIQRGDINDLSVDRAAWDHAYQETLAATCESIRPHLPAKVNRILDIGSGLGGIHVLLNRHYHGQPEFCLIDGVSDEPIMERHATTFSNERVTREFLKANGVRRVTYHAPGALPEPKQFQLIVSFASWCFHYPPGHYLSYVKRSLRPGGTLIVDVRRGKDKWRAELNEAFRFLTCAHNGRKFDRLVYAG